MADPKRKTDCEDCGSNDVTLTPGVGGELYGECPECDRSTTEYDRGYMVVDSDDDSIEARDARIENDRRGFLW